MKRLVILIAAALWLGASAATAQVGGSYNLTWNTVDGGGATFSTGGTYSLGGTIGQADAQPQASGGTYVLQGGFWSPPGWLVHMPVTRKP
ncbi:MAG: hypothetical protein NZM18_04995 [Thermoflexales bacterium]|nr:hypothetical protein [Thermoflexales bacterium]MDW8351483.1 hypothetical protein [Anaerolineae bacterium]